MENVLGWIAGVTNLENWFERLHEPSDAAHVVDALQLHLFYSRLDLFRVLWCLLAAAGYSTHLFIVFLYCAAIEIHVVLAGRVVRCPDIVATEKVVFVALIALLRPRVLKILEELVDEGRHVDWCGTALVKGLSRGWQQEVVLLSSCKVEESTFGCLWMICE